MNRIPGGTFFKAFMLDDRKLPAKYRREKFPTRDRFASASQRTLVPSPCFLAPIACSDGGAVSRSSALIPDG
jgi:hypothetical protein